MPSANNPFEIGDPDEFEKEMNELLLINEVREYIESEREKHRAATDQKTAFQDNPFTPDTPQ